MNTQTKTTALADLLAQRAADAPDRIAAEDEQGNSKTYAELDREADRLATRLARWGVGKGDRVGVLLPKCLEAVAAIHGILRAGAAYVPVDRSAPIVRGAGILADAAVKCVILPTEIVEEFRSARPHASLPPRLIAVGEAGSISAADACTWNSVMTDDAPSPLLPEIAPDDLAYVLYTSGSTGKPKGVMLTHQNAFTFIDWCREALDLEGLSRFSSHAPFHFDLSIFDLFVSCSVGGTVVLIGERTGRDPEALCAFLARAQIDAWYSAPSALALLCEYGGLADLPPAAAPGLVLFAGEVFPIPKLRELRRLWPSAAMWNLYGPTETNVCTAHPIPPRIPYDRTEPFPIGKVCEPLRAKVIDDRGRCTDPGEIGELVISGPGVMRGYFGRPDLDRKAFWEDDDGVRWYRTGDLVIDSGDGVYDFRGRRDRMIKKRGYRIELGEIESALHEHPDIERAAVVAGPPESGPAVTAFVTLKPGRKKSVISIKRHCAARLPLYMTPDSVEFLPEMPATSTDKVDYQSLRHQLIIA